jgi:short-subunit dehydrogenase
MIGASSLFWVDGSKKKRLIVNVGSFAGFAPTPVFSFVD